MQRYAQVIRLRAEAEAEYIRYHASVWPGVLKAIEDCNIRNYSIFLRDHTLFAYFEYHGADYAADMRRMAQDADTQRWWAIMNPMQYPVEGAAPGTDWTVLGEVFHFDGGPLG